MAEMTDLAERRRDDAATRHALAMEAIGLIRTALHLQRSTYEALIKWSPLSNVAAADMIRAGHVIFRQEGVWYPRGHLGDFTPFGGYQFDYEMLRLKDQ